MPCLEFIQRSQAVANGATNANKFQVRVFFLPAPVSECFRIHVAEYNRSFLLWQKTLVVRQKLVEQCVHFDSPIGLRSNKFALARLTT